MWSNWLQAPLCYCFRVIALDVHQMDGRRNNNRVSARVTGENGLQLGLTKLSITV